MTMDALLDRFEQHCSRMDAKAFSPNPQVAPKHRAEIEAAAEAFERDVLSPVTERAREIEDAAEADQLRNVIAASARDLAGLLGAAGAETKMKKLLVQARSLAPSSFIRDEARAAQDAPNAFIQLTYGRHLANHAKFVRSQRVLKKARGMVPEEGAGAALASSVEQALSQGSVIGSSGPSLSTLNGIGGGFWGKRDVWPDGSYVTTHSLVLLFLPIFPFAAYRVLNAGGSYQVLRRLPLTPFARWSRVLLPLVICGVAGVAGFGWYNERPESKAQALIAEAVAADDAGNAGAANGFYHQLFSQFGRSVSPTVLSEAAQAYVPRLIAKIEAAPNVEQRPGAYLTALQGMGVVPAELRAPFHNAIVSALQTRLSSAKSVEAAHASERVLAQARTSLGTPVIAPLEPLWNEIRLRRASDAEQDSPLVALGLFLDAGHAAGAARVLRRAPLDDTSLVVDLKSEIGRFSQIDDAPADLKADLATALADAEKELQSAARVKALQGNDPTALSAYAKAHPRDQAIFRQRYNAFAGEELGADFISAMDKATVPGFWLIETKYIRALALWNVDRRREAEKLLTEVFEARVPPYQMAVRDYLRAADAFDDLWLQNAQNDRLPYDLKGRLKNLSDDEANTVFWNWVEAQKEIDVALSAMLKRVQNDEGAVDIALETGMLRLEVALSADDDKERARWLKAAEEAYLSVRAANEGDPTYHLNLGEVYYRLGKQTAGEAEFDTIRHGTVEPMRVRLVHVYRQLGERERAREFATSAYDSATEKVFKYAYAYALALLSSGGPDEEMWLKRCDPEDADVQLLSKELRASTLARSGDNKGADKIRAEIVKAYLSRTTGNPNTVQTAFNNAAGAASKRFSLTGDIAHLNTAARLYKKSFKINPEDPLVAANYAQALAEQRRARIAAQLVELPALRPTSGELGAIASFLRDTPKAKTGKRRYASSSATRDERKVIQLLLALAPSNSSAYDLMSDLHVLQDDVVGLTRLVERAKRATFNEQGNRRDAKAAMDGKYDTMQREYATTRIAHLQSVLARKDIDKVTRAVAAALAGSSLSRRGLLDRSAADVEQAIAALKKAQALSQKLHVESLLASAWLRKAILERADDPVVAQALKGELKAIGDLEWLLMLRRDGNSQTVQKIVQSEAFKKAAALHRALPTHAIGVRSLLTAQLSQDDKWEREVAVVLKASTAEKTLELNALVFPGYDGQTFRFRQYQKARKALDN